MGARSLARRDGIIGRGLLNRALHILSVTLITAGLVVLADVGITLAWKEPLSTLYGELQQRQARKDLKELEDRFPSPRDLRAIEDVEDAGAKVRELADRFAQRVESGQIGTGESIGRITIPEVGLEAVFVEGTDTSSLQTGPGHYPETPFPGQRGTTAIAGHRTTYLAPFRDIDSLDLGDEIELEMPYATLVYEVEQTEIVEPTQLSVIRRVDHQRLVLSACHPLYSAAQRYIVFARLEDVTLSS
jgi:sortase A